MKNISQTKLCLVYNWGLIGYPDSLELQRKLVEARLNDEIPDLLLLVQHPPVITMGKSGGEDNILVPLKVLAKRGISVFYTDRGGNITCHGPGQLVGYPILNLDQKHIDLHWYLHSLEEVIIRTLAHLFIPARRDPCKPGIWVGEEEICAIGIRVTRWATSHGFALNVNNDLSHFSYINPCGVIGKKPTSISKLLGHEVSIDNIVPDLVQHFSQIFDVNCVSNPLTHLVNTYDGEEILSLAYQKSP